MEITNEQLIKILELAGVDKSVQDVEESDLTKALLTIQDRLFVTSSNVAHVLDNNIKVLVVDDLELSTYQLSVLLKKIGAISVIARSKEEAMSEIRKQKFDFILIDLFLPDEQDGLELMQFAKEFKEENLREFKIIGISATDDLDLVGKCFDVGIDEFITKNPKWHESVIKLISSNAESFSSKNYLKYEISDNSCIYNVKNLTKKEYIDELYTNINSTIHSGMNNIILNLNEIKVFKKENSQFFTDIYKSCQAKGGQLIFLTPSSAIIEALDDAYLTDLIVKADTLDEVYAIIADEA